MNKRIRKKRDKRFREAFDRAFKASLPTWEGYFKAACQLERDILALFMDV